MNRKLIVSILINVALIILPLVLQPRLILNYKILIIIAGSILIWLTQPVFSMAETQEKKSSDKWSVLIIIIMSFVSVMVPITIWAYSNVDKNSFTLLTLIGIFFIFSGILLRAWSVRSLGIYFTPTVQIQKEHKLITTGPYKLIRHPSYSGAFLAITSGALVLDTLIGYAIAITAMTICYIIRIQLEEKEMLSHFGNQYLQYSKKTKKLIPFIL